MAVAGEGHGNVSCSTATTRPVSAEGLVLALVAAFAGGAEDAAGEGRSRTMQAVMRKAGSWRPPCWRVGGVDGVGHPVDDVRGERW
jgi:hypothetical protein